MSRLSSSSTPFVSPEKGKLLHASLPSETPFQLAREMAECRMLYLSADEEESRDHWRGEYEATKCRYHTLLERLRREG